MAKRGIVSERLSRCLYGAGETLRAGNLDAQWRESGAHLMDAARAARGGRGVAREELSRLHDRMATAYRVLVGDDSLGESGRAVLNGAIQAAGVALDLTPDA